MRHLNYNHLQYFWAVAREGTIARAAEALHVTPQTISGQLKLLEDTVGEPLFERSGRRLRLTPTGQTVFGYAERIFVVGAELAQVVRSDRPASTRFLRVGVVESIPKLSAARIIAPAFATDQPPRIRCQEGSLQSLLADLAVHRLDLVLSDEPSPRDLSVRVYNHALGSSTVSFFAHRSIARRYRRNFPRSLDGAPLLLPTDTGPLRQRLEGWFTRESIEPAFAAEFDDSALLKAFGRDAKGIFPGPTNLSDDITRMYDSVQIGEIPDVLEHFFLISPERRLRNAAVQEITEAAKADLADDSQEVVESEA